MTTEGKDQMEGMDPGDDAALWSLLGRHEPPVKVSPYFTRRVLREIALDERPRSDWHGRWHGLWSLRPRHTAVWSGALAFGMLCLSAMLTLPAHRASVAMPRPTEVAVGSTPGSIDAPALSGEPTTALASSVAVQDEEVIADLDTLLSREESRLWTEDTDAARF